MSGRRAGPCAATALMILAGVAPPSALATVPNPLSALVDAAMARLQTADPVAAFKWLTNASIEDPVRAEQVVATVTADAVSQGMGADDADYVRQIFTDQIDATEAVEYGRFSQWKLDPSGAPTTAPDLSASRSAIDALNHTMVAQIAAQRQVMRSPDCAADRDDAVSQAVSTRQSDSLYRAALVFATRSYCRPANF